MPAPKPLDRRPPRFPPPQFPVRRPAMFAENPPAIFPVILGLLGTGLALRKACAALGLSGGPVAGLVEAALGAVAGLWGFAILAITVKLIRRPSVLIEDLRPLPGRAGWAAASMSGMAMAGVLVPYAPGLALPLAAAALAAHGGLALIQARLISRDVEAKRIDPTWHLSFVGFIVAAPVLAQLGWLTLARMIFAATFLAALLIWLVSAVQLTQRIPPAPLRPLLAIHLSAAALLSTSAHLIGQDDLAGGLLVFATLVFLALVVQVRWVLAAGFTPIWGAMTFPLAAYALALLTSGDLATIPGAAISLAALGLVPAIAWRVLRLWPGGRLAAQTNAATA